MWKHGQCKIESSKCPLPDFCGFAPANSRTLSAIHGVRASIFLQSSALWSFVCFATECTYGYIPSITGLRDSWIFGRIEK
jgi:hypothetical protein